MDAGIFLHNALLGLFLSLRWFIATLRNPGAFIDDASSGVWSFKYRLKMISLPVFQNQFGIKIST